MGYLLDHLNLCPLESFQGARVFLVLILLLESPNVNQFYISTGYHTGFEVT